MKISADTRISVLIKANPASIEALAGISKHFEKLRNPFLRKVLAPRVSIAEAARIGKCSIEDFFKRLLPLGFELEENVEISPPPFEEKNKKPPFMSELKKENTVILDVRDDLENGQDPFSKIIGTLKKLPAENILLLVNTFKPIPLINLLRKKGYEYYSENQEDGTVHTFLKNSKRIMAIDLAIPNFNADEMDFDTVLKEFNGRIKEIDVCELEMPMPMVTILKELENLPMENVLFVHHKKIPQFLLPELDERKYICLVKKESESEVKLLIYSFNARINNK